MARNIKLKTFIEKVKSGEIKHPLAIIDNDNISISGSGFESNEMPGATIHALFAALGIESEDC